MAEIIITLIVISFVVYGIAKGWYTQAILIIAGFSLRSASASLAILVNVESMISRQALL